MILCVGFDNCFWWYKNVVWVKVWMYCDLGKYVWFKCVIGIFKV